MGNILVEHRNGTALLALDRGTTNAIDLNLVRELVDLLRSAGDDASVRGIVLTGAGGKFFSIGFDIPSLYDLGRTDFERFTTSFDTLCVELYTFPKPTVAAVGGHATAGGCILALCCDYRFVADGRTLMGVNEIKLGLPVPYPADCMLRGLLGTGGARRITDTGSFYGPRDARDIGLADEVVEQESLIPEAVAFVGEIGALPHGAFAVIKENRTLPVTEEIDRHRDEREQVFLDRWYAEPARTLLREAIAKF
jgi:enoyl-CoA hydratase/carnithine racemase